MVVIKKITLIALCCMLLCSCAGGVPEAASEVEQSEEIQLTEPEKSEDESEPTYTLPENFGKEGGVTVGELEQGRSYVAYAEPLCEIISPHDTCFHAQGGVYVDGYFYSAMIDYENNAVITVANSDGEVVRCSEPLGLDHANSLTYKQNENALYVAHCEGSEDAAYYTYSVIDKDTLEIIKMNRKDWPMTCFAYSEENDMFYSAEWSGEILDMWSGEFSHIKSVQVPVRASLSQGCYANDEGFWYARSAKNEQNNEIVMYNWEGELVYEITFGNLWLELEDIVYISDATMYIQCKNLYTTGAQIYSVTFYEQA